MRKLWTVLTKITAVLVVAAGLSSAGWGQEIRVKFLDGQTGRPLTYEGATMWLGTYTRFLVAPAHNKEGTAKFLYTGHSIRAVWPDNKKKSQYDATELTIPPGLERIAVGPEVAAGICWDLGSPPHDPWYPISEVLQHGAVSENHCGKATAKAQPGELILFIRPLSIWQRLLDGFQS
ncbi:MAG TPA: hypothetical protein VFW94_20250 [Candidatus Acidoferrales bacterium]|nr:hypothetical protein [Candidatus Acidoferrales bacterium]